MPLRFKFSILAVMIWTALICVGFATYRLSESLSQSVFVLGCCTVIIGLLQQVVWIKGLVISEEYRSSQWFAIAWRLAVVVAMIWSIVLLAAVHQQIIAPGLNGSPSGDSNPMVDMEQLAIAALAAGCACGVMTAPWLRLNRLAQSCLPIRSYVYGTLATILLALIAAFDSGATTALLDIIIQSVLNGMSEPVAVSSGALPTSLSRGNALNSLFVHRSVRAWVGAVIALTMVSIVARNSVRSRFQWMAALVAMVLTIPAIFFVYWFYNAGYEKVALLLWSTHEWPLWQAWSLAILPLGVLTAMLSIKRQRIELLPRDPPPFFLCDSYPTYFALVATPVMAIWSSVGSLLSSGLGEFVAAMNGRLVFTAQLVVSDAMGSTGGMLQTALASLCLGAVVSRIRYTASMPRSLNLVRLNQLPLAILTLVLVLMVVLCTIPFSVSLIYVGI